MSSCLDLFFSVNESQSQIHFSQTQVLILDLVLVFPQKKKKKRNEEFGYMVSQYMNYVNTNDIIIYFNIKFTYYGLLKV